MGNTRLTNGLGSITVFIRPARIGRSWQAVGRSVAVDTPTASGDNRSRGTPPELADGPPGVADGKGGNRFWLDV